MSEPDPLIDRKRNPMLIHVDGGRQRSESAAHRRSPGRFAPERSDIMDAVPASMDSSGW
ncbi:hypothetical protein [Streptomyces cylindrosporus]|uniref:Uncharacterized protein n=1 Tax=Streptomyces cylindrosporus TaxID=2927583 RepID=A0ABS9YC21_9ACTN|nr:hypothetical protein [Streptomyces cylindrosporus]MCI3273451.1 hypothetical protein [Streptomyces cylindrosporus]